MKLITPNALAKSAAGAWVKQYGTSKADITAALMALENPTPELVAGVIGSGSWTRTACDECGADNIPVVQLGDEPGYDSSAVYACLSCLGAAVELIAQSRT